MQCRGWRLQGFAGDRVCAAPALGSQDSGIVRRNACRLTHLMTYMSEPVQLAAASAHGKRRPRLELDSAVAAASDPAQSPAVRAAADKAQAARAAADKAKADKAEAAAAVGGSGGGSGGAGKAKLPAVAEPSADKAAADKAEAAAVGGGGHSKPRLHGGIHGRSASGGQAVQIAASSGTSGSGSPKGASGRRGGGSGGGGATGRRALAAAGDAAAAAWHVGCSQRLCQLRRQAAARRHSLHHALVPLAGDEQPSIPLRSTICPGFHRMSTSCCGDYVELESVDLC